MGKKARYEVGGKVYDFIVDYKMQHQGNTPSNMAIAEGVGLCGHSNANYWVNILVADGSLEKNERMLTVPGFSFSETE